MYRHPERFPDMLRQDRDILGFYLVYFDPAPHIRGLRSRLAQQERGRITEEEILLDLPDFLEYLKTSAPTDPVRFEAEHGLRWREFMVQNQVDSIMGFATFCALEDIPVKSPDLGAWLDETGTAPAAEAPDANAATDSAATGEASAPVSPLDSLPVNLQRLTGVKRGSDGASVILEDADGGSLQVPVLGEKGGPLPEQPDHLAMPNTAPDGKPFKLLWDGEFNELVILRNSNPASGDVWHADLKGSEGAEPLKLSYGDIESIFNALGLARPAHIGGKVKYRRPVLADCTGPHVPKYGDIVQQQYSDDLLNSLLRSRRTVEMLLEARDRGFKFARTGSAAADDKTVKVHLRSDVRFSHYLLDRALKKALYPERTKHRYLPLFFQAA
jgi:hypothetical protein